MRVVRPCRGWPVSLLLPLLGSLLLSACGSNNSFSPGTPVVSMGNPGTMSDFAAYFVTIDGISFIQANGTTVTPLVEPETVNLVNLGAVTELVEAPAVQTGTYTQLQITLDYSSASLWLNIGGQAIAADPIDITGVTYTGATITVNFDPNNPLVINNQESVRLAITIDPAIFNTATTSTSPYEVVVQPFVVASPVPVDSTVMRARGLFVVSQPQSSNFIMNMRPFYDLVSALGALQVNINPQTYFNINGLVYTGAAGLNAMTTQQENFPVAAYGTLDDLSTITPTFNATQVYMGVSLESPVAEYVYGTIAERTGNTLEIRGATFLSPFGTVGYFDQFPVTIGSDTLVQQTGVAAASNQGIGAVSIGQQITVWGQEVTDSNGNPTSLDATQGQILLQPTPLWGTLNSAVAGSASFDVLTLGNYAPAGLNFTGTGSTPANPAAYQVSTGALDLASTSPGTLLLATGIPTPFGSAPPDFSASIVTPGTATEQQLLVDWTGNGVDAPFSSLTSSGLVINLANPALGADHYIRTGPATLDLKSLPASPLITTTGATASNLQLAVGSASLGIFVFNSWPGFESKLTSIIDSTNLVYRLVAYGQYNSGTNTFVASRIDVAIHL